MLEGLEIDPSNFEEIEKFANNRERTIFNLPKRECLILVSGYSLKLRAAIPLVSACVLPSEYS